MDKFEEYKFFVESTQFLTERRQNAAQTYITVNTAIFTVLAFLAKDAGFRGWTLVLVSLPLIIVGLLVCLQWHRVITQYKSLIGWRYDQLMAMERAMPDSYQMYVKEWEDFYKPQQGKKRFGFSRLEVGLPKMLFGLYLIFGIGLVIL
jgi:hypothetical protein